MLAGLELSECDCCNENDKAIDKYIKAKKVAIIDHGKILITGTIEEILQKSGTEKLEEAFIKLTGSKIREEAGNVGLNQMRISNKLMGK